jgi:hypothetical protein
MCNKKIEESFDEDIRRKRFFGQNNRLLRAASSIINQLYGNNEERLAQFEMIAKTEQFQKKYPGLVAKDVATIVRIELSEH